MVGRDGLLGGSDQELGLAALLSCLNLVQVLAKVRELASGSHNGLLQEERRLEGSVLLLGKSGKTIVDQSLVQENTGSLQVVSLVTSGSGTSLHLKDVKALHDFVVMEFAKSRAINNEFLVRFTESANNLVIVFSLGNNNIGSNDVSDFTEKGVHLLNSLISMGQILSQLGIKSLRLGNFFFALVLSLGFLLLLGDNLGDIVFLFLKSFIVVLG